MDLRTAKVLILDDVAIAREVLKSMLVRFGFNQKNIIELGSGATALEEIIEKNCSLVISDWAMPEVEGIDLLRQVRANPKTATIPFILTTSFSEREKVDAALHSGVTDFLLKPFSYATLEAKLTSIFKKV